MKLLGILVIGLGLTATGCTIGQNLIRPGMDKCVYIELDEGSLGGGPVNIQGKGLVYRSIDKEKCNETVN